MRIIKIKPMGNVGNQMLQYIFARMLQARVPNCTVFGYDMPMWGLKSPDSPALQAPLVIRSGHQFDITKITEFLHSRENTHLDYGGYGQRLEYCSSADFSSSLFPKCISDNAPFFGDDYIVINIRGSEIFSGIHQDYLPIPLFFYKELVSITNKKPIFIGQIDNSHFYIKELRRNFQDSYFLMSRGPADDFEILRRATNVVPSVSSFSWLATWMSHKAKSIFLPMLGFINPKQRPDINLVPTSDTRYRFFEFPVVHWTGSEDNWRYVLKLERP